MRNYIGTCVLVSACCPEQKSSRAERLLQECIDRYNNIRLHSAIGYVTPRDKLAGRSELIFAAREQKLAYAREQRKRIWVEEAA